jgi:RNA polymerase sigma-70 factor (ECF subfamily)
LTSFEGRGAAAADFASVGSDANVGSIRAAAPSYTSDEVLVAALRRGDEEAFAWLLDRYTALLRRAARAYTPSESVADEIVQETWIGVITGIGRFEMRSSVKTWLYRIMANIARTRGTRERRSIPFTALGPVLDGGEPAFEPNRFRTDPDAPWFGNWASFPSTWPNTPEDQVEAGETLALVRAAIDGLPPTQREVVTLRDLEGWSASEVCDALNVSDSNQRVLLHRGRMRVRRALELHYEAMAT